MFPAGLTDTGLHREKNEDSLFLCGEPFHGLPNLYIVADGIGGHNAGEVASGKTVEFFMEYCGQNTVNPDETMDFLVNGVIYANGKVFDMARQNPGYNGMGTTFSACVYETGRLYVAHVGDSRIYAVYGDRLKQITNDHTFVREMVKAGNITEKEAKTHPKRNMLTRAVGTDRNLMVDGQVFNIGECEKILLCTDGLTDMLSDDDIFVAVQNGNNDEIAAGLVAQANKNGGADNITVIVFDVGGCGR
jgi:protein phosphatase